MKKFARGLFLGGLIGAATGLLTAPKKGRETQDDIRRNLDSLSARAAKVTETVAEEAEKQLEQAKPKVQKAKKAIEEAYEAAVEEAARVKDVEETEISAEVREAGDAPSKKRAAKKAPKKRS